MNENAVPIGTKSGSLWKLSKGKLGAAYHLRWVAVDSSSSVLVWGIGKRIKKIINKKNYDFQIKKKKKKSKTYF